MWAKKNHLNSRVSYAIEPSFDIEPNRIVLKSKSNGIELICFTSDQPCATGNFNIKENYKLSFLFQKNYLDSFGNPTFEIPTFIEKELNCNITLLIFEILKTKFTGQFKNMFIESKAVELLLHVLDNDFDNDFSCDDCKFLTKSYEKDKIIAARELLENNLENPPKIAELALEVGINQCYLKKGFKDLFGTSIYAFVQEQRIIKAKLLLKSTDNSIGEIAEIVGFSNTSNFSNAFKTYTGILPSQLRND